MGKAMGKSSKLILAILLMAQGGSMNAQLKKIQAFKDNKVCTAAIVEWVDAIGFSKNVAPLQNKSPSELLELSRKVTIGCVSMDKDAVLVVQEFDKDGDNLYPSDYTLIERHSIRKIILLEEQHEPDGNKNPTVDHPPSVPVVASSLRCRVKKR